VDDVIHLADLQDGEGAGFLIGGDNDRGAEENRITVFHDITEGNERPKHVLDGDK